MASTSAKMPRKLSHLARSDRAEDWKIRDCESAVTANVGASRPYTALLWKRVCKWNARKVIERTITA